MSCPHAVDATQRCVPLTSLHGLAPAFSRLGRWWRNSRLGVRPSGVGVAAMEHVVSHPPKSQSRGRIRTRRACARYLGEARRDGDCSIEDEAWWSALCSRSALGLLGAFFGVRLDAGAAGRTNDDD